VIRSKGAIDRQPTLGSLLGCRQGIGRGLEALNGLGAEQELLS